MLSRTQCCSSECKYLDKIVIYQAAKRLDKKKSTTWLYCGLFLLVFITHRIHHIVEDQHLHIDHSNSSLQDSSTKFDGSQSSSHSHHQDNETCLECEFIAFVGLTLVSPKLFLALIAVVQKLLTSIFKGSIWAQSCITNINSPRAPPAFIA